MLRSLRGHAVVFCFASLREVPELRLLALSGMVHRCRTTVLADLEGNTRTYSARHWLSILPVALMQAAADLCLFAFAAVYLRRLISRAVPARFQGNDSELVYLSPYSQRLGIGGAASHIKGFLGGLRENATPCRVFAGREGFPAVFATTVVDAKRRSRFFREAETLSFNWCFARAVRPALAANPRAVIYQRHGRYTVAGALLANWLHVPLVLEYNGSEVWVAQHWDPTRMATLLRLAEEVSIRSASLLVVVSSALRDDLLAIGISENRILVNPNGVDPDQFRVPCDRRSVRQELGLAPDDVVICFVGSFSYWHGVGVLAEAIRLLLEKQNHVAPKSRIRFLLVGAGPLHAETKTTLRPFIDSAEVIMTGAVEHERVPQLLAASDILTSPHVPMPDGSRFFGSPTKLFEYMASGKAIIASGLDQIAEVLEHQQTAWLVPPGDAAELARAVALLADDEVLRQKLGANAQEVACRDHTWAGNAARVMSAVGLNGASDGGHGLRARAEIVAASR